MSGNSMFLIAHVAILNLADIHQSAMRCCAPKHCLFGPVVLEIKYTVSVCSRHRLPIETCNDFLVLQV